MNAYVVVTITILVVLAIALVAGNFFLLLRMGGARKRKVRMIQQDLNTLRLMLEEYGARAAIIEKHAIDYFSAMSGEANEAFSKAKVMLIAIKQLADELEELLYRGSSQDISVAEALLRSQLKLQKSAVNTLNSSPDLPDVFFDEWAPMLDELFQIVGEEVSAASKNSLKIVLSQNGGKKSRKRGQTLLDLKSAGIDINRNSKANNKQIDTDSDEEDLLPPLPQ